MPDMGKTAPDFELTSDVGEIVRLSDFRGKKVFSTASPSRGPRVEQIMRSGSVMNPNESRPLRP
jgi:hypothetical protein